MLVPGDVHFPRTPRTPNRPAAIRVNRRIRRAAIKELAARIRRYYPDSQYGHTRILRTVLQSGLMGPSTLMKLTRLDERDLALFYSIGAPMGGGRVR